MSEFKGTKGKWKIEDIKSPYETTINSSEYRIAEVKHFEGKNFNDPIEKEAKANALLISKAPEFYQDAINDLELLERVAKQLDELGGYLESDVLDRIQQKKQLIQEATTI